MKLLVTPNGEQHGLINSVANSVKSSDLKNLDPKIREKAKKKREEDSKIVKARYINFKGPNERLNKFYCQWEGDPIQTWKFIPDQVYEVPMGLINEINEHMGMIVRSEILDSKGVPTMKDGAPRKEHQFIPISFN